MMFLTEEQRQQLEFLLTQFVGSMDESRLDEVVESNMKMSKEIYLVIKGLLKVLQDGKP